MAGDSTPANPRYAPFYCEENVYWLAHDDRAGEVVLISNEHRTVALCGQRLGRGPAGLVVWDYHAVYVRGGLVYDLDTALAYPCPLDTYREATFPAAIASSRPDLAPWFSTVAANRYVESFSCDRSHMRDAAGRYIHPPPPWPALYDPRLGSTLFALVDGVHEAVRARTTILGS